MATAASGAGSEGDFEPPPPSLVEHGGGSDSGQGGGLVFGGGGGHLDPLRHGRASARSGSRFLDVHACARDMNAGDAAPSAEAILKQIGGGGEG